MNTDVYCLFFTLCNVGPAIGLTVLCSILLKTPSVIIIIAMTRLGYIMANGNMPTSPIEAVRERF